MKYFFPAPEDESERELFDRIVRSEAPQPLRELTPEVLLQLTKREGCDFATALLHRRIVDSAEHGPFLRALGQVSETAPLRPVRVAIVPGAFYRENPRTGADGRIPREVAESLGLPVSLIPVSGTGSLAENARILAEWLLAHREEPILLVSVSKGGSDVKTALARPDALQVFARVSGWLNVCGILEGTPMADWLLSSSLLAIANRFVYRARGRSLEFLTDLRRVPGSPLARPLALPSGMRAIHVVGFPLRRHLRNGLVRRCHARLEAFGPNDGSILLADCPRWPGQLCPVWGADHYLRPEAGERPLLAALFRSLASSESAPLLPL